MQTGIFRERPVCVYAMFASRCAWLFFAMVALACKPNGSGAASDDGSRPVSPTVPDRAPSDTTTAAVVASEPFELPPPPSALPPPPPPSADAAGQCPKKASDRDSDVGIVVAPFRPVVGQPVTVLVSSLAGEDALAVRLEDTRGQPIAAEVTHRRGAPAATVIRFTPKKPVKFRVVVGRDGTGQRCYVVWARRRPRVSDPPSSTLEQVWATSRAWTMAEEALYSAWVRELFWAPRGEDLAVDGLDRLTAEPTRNVLHNALGYNEDSPRDGLKLRPDCADTPYFLRAYFAWKRGLPFGFRHCSRGSADTPPRCREFLTNEHAPDLTREWREILDDPLRELEVSELDIVQHFFRRTLAWGVHTGNGRTPYTDSESDHYPVRLSRSGIRPGIIYADPYGHVFVVVDLLDGETGSPGVLYAIDGQPDGSITRKRFWEGNFLWNPAPHLGGSGFKAFRPLSYERGEADTKVLAAWPNEVIAKRYGDIDVDVGKLDAPAFYDRMDALITPGQRDPYRAQAEAIVALAEAVRVRLTSVENGEAYVATHPGEIIEMPWGHDVFETVGSWENYSTPARDLRLLVAMDVVRTFSDKVSRQPAAYGVDDPAQLPALLSKLAAQREQMLADPQYSIRYVRSDKSEHTLSLRELFRRAEQFEIAYNPNDCVEWRWGAVEGSEEMSTCRRRAPQDQQRRMEAYRVWFRDRRRPSRGDPGPDVPGVERPAG